MLWGISIPAVMGRTYWHTGSCSALGLTPGVCSCDLDVGPRMHACPAGSCPAGLSSLLTWPSLWQLLCATQWGWWWPWGRDGNDSKITSLRTQSTLMYCFCYQWFIMEKKRCSLLYLFIFFILILLSASKLMSFLPPCISSPHSSLYALLQSWNNLSRAL